MLFKNTVFPVIATRKNLLYVNITIIFLIIVVQLPALFYFKTKNFTVYSVLATVFLYFFLAIIFNTLYINNIIGSKYVINYKKILFMPRLYILLE